MRSFDKRYSKDAEPQTCPELVGGRDVGPSTGSGHVDGAQDAFPAPPPTQVSCHSTANGRPSRFPTLVSRHSTANAAAQVAFRPWFPVTRRQTWVPNKSYVAAAARSAESRTSSGWMPGTAAMAPLEARVSGRAGVVGDDRAGGGGDRVPGDDVVRIVVGEQHALDLAADQPGPQHRRGADAAEPHRAAGARSRSARGTRRTARHRDGRRRPCR